MVGGRRLAVFPGGRRPKPPGGPGDPGQLIENARIAREEQVPICQDTGLAVVFLEIGQDVHLMGGDVKEAVHEGSVRVMGRATCAVLLSSFHPGQYGDNTPAVIYLDIVPGDRVRVMVVPKGGQREHEPDPYAPAFAGLAGVKDRWWRRSGRPAPIPVRPPSSGGHRGHL